MDTYSPMVTICIPCYEQPHCLFQCLKSVSRQTFKDFEVVIIDDASKSDYEGVLNQFPYLKTKYVRNRKNLGAIPNMMKALHYESSSKYIMVFHEDDLMHPRLLEVGVRVLEKHSDIAFVGTNMITFYDYGALPDLDFEVTGKYEHHTDVSCFVRSLLSGAGFCFGSVIYRRSKIENMCIDLKRFSVVGDRPFLCEIVKDHQCAFIREPLVCYRSHEFSDNRGRSLTEDHLIELCAYYRSCLPEKLSKRDKILFYNYSTNNLLDSYSRLIDGDRTNILSFVLKGMKKGVFSVGHIDWIGLKVICQIFKISALLRFMGKKPRFVP